MGVVWEPVDPATAAPPPQLCDVGRSEARALEDEHHVDGPCTQARRQPRGEGASQQGVPPSAPLLAAAHLTSQPLERGGEGQAAPVVATVERRDQYDAQTREGARRHTSTKLRYSKRRLPRKRTCNSDKHSAGAGRVCGTVAPPSPPARARAGPRRR